LRHHPNSVFGAYEIPTACPRALLPRRGPNRFLPSHQCVGRCGEGQIPVEATRCRPCAPAYSLNGFGGVALSASGCPAGEVYSTPHPFHAERQICRAAYRRQSHVALGSAHRSCTYWHQVRMRRRHLWGLHSSLRRQGHPFVPDRAQGHRRPGPTHHRGLGGREQPSSATAGVHRSWRFPMRVLHFRHGDDRGRFSAKHT